MSVSLGDIWVAIRVSNEGLDKGLAEAEAKVKGFSGKIEGFLNNAVGFATGAAMYDAFGKITGAVGNMVKMAMESEDVQADLQATLKATKGAAGLTADEINRMALELSKMTPFADDAIVKGQAMLLTFDGIGREVFPRATEAMLDIAQKMGKDVPGAALILGKALQFPGENLDGLKRMGIILSDEQKDLIKSFMAVGDKADAQGVILDALAGKMGGMAKAAGEAGSGPLTIFNNRIAKISTDIGTGLLPTINTLLEKIMTLTDKLMGKGGNEEAWTKVTAAITAFMATPIGAVLDNANSVISILNSLLGQANTLLETLGIKTQVVTGETNLWITSFGVLTDAIKTILGGPLVWLKVAVDGITDAIKRVRVEMGLLPTLGGGGFGGFATGGVVPGPIGAPMMAVVHGGETITPPAGRTSVTNNETKMTRVYIQTLNLTGVQNAAGLLREIEALG